MPMAVGTVELYSLAVVAVPVAAADLLMVPWEHQAHWVVVAAA